MNDLLLITDDLSRGDRLARDLRISRGIRVHDLYEDVLPSGIPELIVSDVSALTSDAITRLRCLLARVRGEGVPYIFLAHGNTDRAEAQARMLNATNTLRAGTVVRSLVAALERCCRSVTPAAATAERHAGTARQFLADVFVPDRLLTPEVVDTGAELIEQAIRETQVQDWINAVRRFDEATHQHCLLVAGLAAAFAQSLRLAAADSFLLTKAALMHDIGKIHVPKEILNKAGKLTPAERVEIETHPVRGHAMLVGRGFNEITLAVVRSHHEMLDGSGYPDRLKDAEIPDLVRLVTVCDIYGALIERRPYKPPMAGDAAMAILEEMTNRLDADLVRAFRPVAAGCAQLPSLTCSATS